MKLLLVKTSSLGDVVHTFPAVTDAVRACAGIEIHWLVEEAYAALVRLHPGVHQVVPVALRRWRQAPLSVQTRTQWRNFRQQVQSSSYDWIVDAQGLLKSAWLLRYAQGVRYGYDRQSVREPLACLFYDRRIAVQRQLHAVERTRQLLAAALGYAVVGAAQPGLTFQNGVAVISAAEIWLLHGTTWTTKSWPEAHWRQLLEALEERAVSSVLPYGSALEQQRVLRLSAGLTKVRIQPPLSVDLLVQGLRSAQAVVSVDSGLGHLAAALGRPVLGVYGPTDVQRTGLIGSNASTTVSDLGCRPCLSKRCSVQPQPLITGLWPPCMVQLSVAAVLRWIEEQRREARSL